MNERKENTSNTEQQNNDVEQSKRILKFDSGITTQQRVNNSLYQAQIYRREGDLLGWEGCLKGIELEIWPKMTSEQKKESESLYNKLITSKNNRYLMPKQYRAAANNEITLNCEQWEKFLRVILNNLNVLWPEKDGAVKFGQFT